MRLDTVLEVQRKELALFFSSPIGYLFLAAYVGFSLFVFFWGSAFFARNIADVRPMFEQLPVLLIFLSAALTMRMWSEERRSGTLEFMITVQSTTFELVAGKFLACWSLLGIALLLTVPLPLTVAFIGDLDWGPVFAGYIAAMFLGASYISIGLFVSSKTSNQIVALLITCLIGGVLFGVGSAFALDLVSNTTAEIMRWLGTGSRFESITRGVIDFRDLYYYLSIAGIFLVFNVFALDSQGWATDGNEENHRRVQIVSGLCIANLVIANLWLGGINWMRWDLTEGNQYSISQATKSYLSQLREPLLIRGYFSEKTHPLLGPLVPQLQDLLREYELSADGSIRLELIDPAENPELEDEANTKYGILPVPFQVSDRYQASLVNSYFDVLLQYGDEYEVLGFRELIEIKVRGESELDVQLRNPEYDLTRTIKNIVYGFQGGDSVFTNISDPVVFTGYVSADQKLPESLISLRQNFVSVLEELESDSKGNFSWELLDPEQDQGALAQSIAEDYGFQPMAASLFDQNRFYFYLTLSDGETVVQLPIPQIDDAESIRRGIEEGLKRYSEGLLKTVGLSIPIQGQTPQFPGQPPPPPGNQFADLRDSLSASFDVQSPQLETDRTNNLDILFVMDPESLDNKSVFGIDQFLMRGGTVVVSASAFKTVLTQDALTAMPRSTGLEGWLSHNGIEIDESLVLDPQNASFPLPVTRQAGAFSFQDYRMINYPFFIDVRDDQLNQNVGITSGLPQLTMAWASPIEIDEDKNIARSVTHLVRSTDEAWRSSVPDVMPQLQQDGIVSYAPDSDQASQTMAVLVEGRFDSYFDESPLGVEVDESLNTDDLAEGNEIDAAEPEKDSGTVTSVISRSPESARLIVIGSSDFVADQTIRMIGMPDGTIYANSIQMMANIVDWALEDESLLSIRGRGHFNRTLRPLASDEQKVWEYLNYGVALIGVAIVFGMSRYKRKSRQANISNWLGGES